MEKTLQARVSRDYKMDTVFHSAIWPLADP